MRLSECVHLLKVAEGGVALDVVLLLEAVKVARMHVHPGQHLEGRVKGREFRRDSEARQRRQQQQPWLWSSSEEAQS